MSDQSKSPNGDIGFLDALEAALGKRIREDDAFAASVWCALSNVLWKSAGGREFGLTFRAAGGVIADIRGEGDYMDWYCCGQAGVVSDEIADAMVAFGWMPREYPEVTMSVDPSSEVAPLVNALSEFVSQSNVLKM